MLSAMLAVFFIVIIIVAKVFPDMFKADINKYGL